jgi:hypothetical protein
MAITGAPAPAASAEEGEAHTILKAMADYVSRQENLALKYDADVEVVLRPSRRSSSAPPATSP